MTFENTNLPMQIIDPSAIAAAESVKARIQSAYMVAMRMPRNIEQARQNILTHCRRPKFAEKVEYSKPLGGKAIKGASVRFAEMALREWRNIFSETQIVYEDEKIRRIKVYVTDLEANAVYSKEFQLIKTVERKNTAGREVVGERLNTKGEKIFIVLATDDELQTKEAAAISKIIRNEGLRLLPSDIIEEAIETARETLRSGDKSDPDSAKKKLIDSFHEIGVSANDIAKYLKHPLTHIQPAEIEELRTIYRAIRDGESKWADYLEESEPQPNVNGEQNGNGKFVYPCQNGNASNGKPDKPAAAQKTGLPSEKIKALNARVKELGLDKEGIKTAMRRVEMMKNDGRGRCFPFNVESTKDILEDDFPSFMEWLNDVKKADTAMKDLEHVPGLLELTMEKLRHKNGADFVHFYQCESYDISYIAQNRDKWEKEVSQRIDQENSQQQL